MSYKGTCPRKHKLIDSSLSFREVNSRPPERACKRALRGNLVGSQTRTPSWKLATPRPSPPQS